MGNKIRKKSNLLKTMMSILLAAGLLLTSLPAYAAGKKETQFQTKNTIVDAADCYVIVQDTTEKYGLLDEEGEEAIPCEYDEMYFPDNTRDYDYVMVKQGDTWGVLDYEGNELVEVCYKSISPYSNGNTTAAGYDGNKTYLYNKKGKELGQLSGDYSVVTDSIFKGQDDLKNQNDKTILTFSEAGLLDPDDDAEDKTAVCVKMGDLVAINYYFSGNEENKTIIGQLKLERYINIYDEEGELYMSVRPDESWTNDVEEGTYKTGGVKVIDSVSDTSLKVQMTGIGDSYLIYDTKEQSYSARFDWIGDFIDGKAFAIDSDNRLCIIDETGSKISDGEIGISNYTRRDTESTEEAYYLFSHNSEAKYKLYSLSQEKALGDAYKEVTFTGHNYAIVQDEDGNYSVLDEKGEIVIEAGLYSKELLEKALYTDNCICVTETGSELTTVHLYESFVVKDNSILAFLTRPIVIIVAAIILILIIVLIIVFVLRSRKRKLAEEEAERRWKEEQRRKAEQKKQMNRNHLNAGQDIKIVHNSNSSWTKSAEIAKIGGLSGCIKGIRGEYAGKTIQIGADKPFRIGRSH
ncbi:MAG: WG repeat-containing protein, partial [Clostridiales bacterium]|nr:WG repeat-containing protein [Clostridiales bacterium]